MTASAAAASVFFLMVVSAASAAATFATAAATFTAHGVYQAFYLLVGSIAHFDDVSFENQVLAGVWVVQVEHHLVISDFAYIGIESVAFLVVQHDDVTREDVFAIEVAVRVAEHRFRNLTYTVFVAFAVCLVTGDSKAE